jgi:hypothetical protein
MDKNRLPKHALKYKHTEEEEIVGCPGKDGNTSMPEQVKRRNPWGKMMMMVTQRNTLGLNTIQEN